MILLEVKTQLESSILVAQDQLSYFHIVGALCGGLAMPTAEKIDAH